MRPVLARPHAHRPLFSLRAPVPLASVRVRRMRYAIVGWRSEGSKNCAAGTDVRAGRSRWCATSFGRRCRTAHRSPCRTIAGPEWWGRKVREKARHRVDSRFSLTPSQMPLNSALRSKSCSCSCSRSNFRCDGNRPGKDQDWEHDQDPSRAPVSPALFQRQ